ncbi:LOW QUALITY PROTEIN: hypothetical protein PHMEG_00017029 [Phytophthora megakarya]|uniref:Eukaryotic/viral aspartic protease n=1 Tax=Phytophthora megakarya TaxID=4795 RepID=A0A225VXA4_9STRA|nr:LOW QUALITY PROTEIN: hypothetical protein PHMEG_00017029 [Phytophthora megakarya]
MMGSKEGNRWWRLVSTQSTGFESPINEDTPGGNKDTGETLELMMATSSWMQMFGPTLVRQVVWTNHGGELVVPSDSTSTRQVAQITSMLLRAMGCQPQMFPRAPRSTTGYLQTPAQLYASEGKGYT